MLSIAINRNLKRFFNKNYVFFCDIFSIIVFFLLFFSLINEKLFIVICLTIFFIVKFNSIILKNSSLFVKISWFWQFIRNRVFFSFKSWFEFCSKYTSKLITISLSEKICLKCVSNKFNVFVEIDESLNA